jgi:electron transfer flavoprotein beta subunit
MWLISRNFVGCRYASFKAVIAAKKKAIESLGLEELDVQCTPQLKVVKVEEPPKRKVGKMVQSVRELIDELVDRKVMRR